MIEDILHQLFGNAVQATPPGQPPPSVRVAIGEHLRIAVENYGDPIPDAIRHRMSSGERFTTKRFGSGSGLLLVHEYLRQVGGWLEVNSRDGKIEVAVLIPLAGNQISAD